MVTTKFCCFKFSRECPILNRSMYVGNRENHFVTHYAATRKSRMPIGTGKKAFLFCAFKLFFSRVARTHEEVSSCFPVARSPVHDSCCEVANVIFE